MLVKEKSFILRILGSSWFQKQHQGKHLEIEENILSISKVQPFLASRQLTSRRPQEVLRHFMACNLPAVSLRPGIWCQQWGINHKISDRIWYTDICNGYIWPNMSGCISHTYIIIYKLYVIYIYWYSQIATGWAIWVMIMVLLSKDTCFWIIRKHFDLFGANMCKSCYCRMYVLKGWFETSPVPYLK